MQGSFVYAFLELIAKFDLDGYIIPVSDEHSNEIIGSVNDRVKILSRYTGAVGILLAGTSNMFFTSPQFLDQAKKEVKGFDVSDIPVEDYTTGIVSSGMKTVGIYTKTILSKNYLDLKNKLESQGVKLIPFDDDLFDKVWKNKPQRKFMPVFNLGKKILSDFVDTKYVKRFVELKINSTQKYNLNTLIPGEDYKTKLEKLQKDMEKDEGIVITASGEVEWLLNLRGSDLDYSPSFYSFGYLTKKSFTVWSGADIKLANVNSLPYNEFYDFLPTIKEKIVKISGDCSYYVYSKLKDPSYTNEIRVAEAKKNDVEILGFKMAGIKDAVAFIKLLTWIKKNISNELTEIDIYKKLVELKKLNKAYFSESFEAIVASGKNAPLVFHKPDKKIHTIDELLLIDTGTHYYHGTTDITRTVCFGKPTPEIIEKYTVVLKSLIRAKYLRKRSIMGSELDKASRYYFYKIKKDYPTATGHGVGHFSHVHEFLPNIDYNESKLAYHNAFTLEPFYKDSQIGIRIEDMVISTEKDGYVFPISLSYVPLQINMIDNSMLTEEERRLTNLFSKKVRQFLTPLLESDEESLKYLNENTEPLEDVPQTKDVTGSFIGE